MQWIKYKIVQSEIDDEVILVTKKVGYSEANLAIAETEAYNGEYEIIEDSQSLDRKPLGIEFGGTGASTAEDARENLGVGVAETVSGKNPTATNSTDGSVPYLQPRGYTEQKTLSGNNLLAYNNTYKSFTTNQTWTQFNVNGNPFSKGAGTYNYSCSGDFGGAYNYGLWVYDKDNKLLLNISNVGSIGKEIEVTEDVANNTVRVDVVVGGLVSGTTYSGYIYPQISYGATKLDYEPYCGGIPSPNPDYPQRIGGLADKGYFDGVLKQGFIGTNGVFSSSTTAAVTNTNPIFCNSGDTIQLIYEEIITRATEGNYPFFISFYGENSTFISQVYSDNGVSEFETIAPTNAKYFLFDIRKDTTFSVTNAKHICVTINGQYALRVKTTGKNLVYETFEKYSIVDEGKIEANTSGEYSVHIAKVESGKTYTVSTDDGAGFVGGYFTEKPTTSSVAYDKKRIVQTSKTITIPTGVSYVVFRSNYGYGTPQLEEGTVATPYEPHQESQALIPVSSPLYTGDYIEVYADGSGQIVRNNTKFTFVAGSEQNALTNSKELRMAIPSGVNAYGCKCNKAIWNGATWGTDIVGIMGLAGTGNTHLAIRVPVDTDRSTFTADIVAKLITPTSTPLTAEQVAEFLKLRTYKGVTHVTADGEVVMRYYCDNASGDSVSMLQGMVEDLKESTTVNVKMTKLSNTWKQGGSYGVSINNMTYGKDKFVGVGYDGAACYSADCSVWTACTGLSGSLYDIAYGGDKFVAVGDGATYYSVDGVTWSSGTGASGVLRSVIYEDGKFIAVGDNAIYYSTDGIAWTTCGTISGELYGVAYGNDKFIAVGKNGVIYSSTNGTTWSRSVYDSGFNFSKIVYGSGKFVAKGNTNTSPYTNKELYSADGATWGTCTGVSSGSIYGLVYGDGEFIAVCYAGETYHSTDGVIWSLVEKISENLLCVTYGNGKFVTVSESKKMSHYLELEFIDEQRKLEDIINELYSLLR